MRERFLTGLRIGLPLVHAAAIAGIGARTVYDWQQRERAGDADYNGVTSEIELARQAGRGALLQRIIRAGQDPKHWTALAWVLERTAPQEFSRTDRVIVERAKEEYGVELGERVLARLPTALERLGLPAEKAPDLLAALLGEDASAPAELEGEIVSPDETTEDGHGSETE